MQLTSNFSLEQLTYSETARREGIDNLPPPEIVSNLMLLAQGLERVQALMGFPLEISSSYRCPELNRRVGGAPKSQHTLGLAADFTCADFGTPVDIIQAVRASDIAFDQCILEYAKWVHMSFSKAPRGRILSIYNAKQGYLDGLRDPEGKQIA